MRILQQSIEGGEEFSGGGDEGDFEGFAGGAEALAEGFEDGVVADGVEGGHGEGAAHAGPAAGDAARARRGPLSSLKGATPASAARERPLRVPSSGRCPRSVAAVPGPTPWIEQSRAVFAASSGVEASSSASRAVTRARCFLSRAMEAARSRATGLGRPGICRVVSAESIA